MKTEQIERLVKLLQDRGYGWIAKEELRKIVLLVWGELVVEAVFQPLEGDADVLTARKNERTHDDQRIT